VMTISVGRGADADLCRPNQLQADRQVNAIRTRNFTVDARVICEGGSVSRRFGGVRRCEDFWHSGTTL
jgi:hypothetical protein